MNINTIPFLLCTNCGAKNWLTEKFISKGNRIIAGRIICKRCKIWFRIENGILDLLSLALRRDELYELFSKKYHLKYTPGVKNAKAIKGKLSQITFFKDTIDEYENAVVNSKFYKAQDRVLFWDWVKRNISEKDFVLDLGCGTARQCIPLARAKARVIGVDITEEMLILGKQKIKKAGVDDFIDLIVADCENLPVIDNHFTACVFYGTLHHIPRPGKALESASSKLKAGGLIYAMEPNKSPLRFLFDLSMTLSRLWEEDRDEGELISENLFRKWVKNSRLSAKIKFSTYLPPHFFYLLKFNSRVNILSGTDRLFEMIPFIRTFGGMIILEGKKS